ncbi:MAG: Bax inhibitor-1 family protein [Pirellulales bacterium]
MAILIALGVVVCGMIFGFSQGIWFSAVMIAIMAGYILYDTSNVMYHYRTTQHVAAALALFSSVVTLFVYIVRFLLEVAVAQRLIHGHRPQQGFAVPKVVREFPACPKKPILAASKG